MEFPDEFMSAANELYYLLQHNPMVYEYSDLYAALENICEYPVRCAELKAELEQITPKLEKLEKEYQPYEEILIADPSKMLNLQEVFYKLYAKWPEFKELSLLKGRVKAIHGSLEFLETSVKNKVQGFHEKIALRGDELSKAFPETAKSVSILKKFKFNDSNPPSMDGDGNIPGTLGE